jgi:phenylacetaldehyde dehydrogenase
MAAVEESTQWVGAAGRAAAEEAAGRSWGLFIDGSWVEPASGETFAVENPATGRELCRVAAGGAADVDRAVAAARKAFEYGSPWRAMSASERGKLVWRIGDLLAEHADELVYLESLDTGKTLAAASLFDVPVTIDSFHYMAGWATKIEGSTVSIAGYPGRQYHAYTLREPVGVVGVITPWNFPLLITAWSLAPALAAGCTLVLKPAEQAPLVVLRLAELCQEAGLPDGVVNVVTGTGESAGAPLGAHEDVDKISFTGSTEVGKLLIRASAGNLKHVMLELGGKSPHMVFADADVPAAATTAGIGVFYNHGQACIAGSRIFAQRDVYDDVLEGVVNYANSLTMGPGQQDGVDMGPLISREQVDRVVSYVEAGIADGAKVVTGGQRLDRDGYFFAPTVLDGTSPEMSVQREEIFGPVATTIPFKDEDDLIRLANDTNYGLAAGIWTRDIGKAHRIAARIEAGTVWINSYAVFDNALPFGGYKQSGLGRENGREGVEDYLQTKVVVADIA